MKGLTWTVEVKSASNAMPVGVISNICGSVVYIVDWHWGKMASHKITMNILRYPLNIIIPAQLLLYMYISVTVYTCKCSFVHHWRDRESFDKWHFNLPILRCFSLALLKAYQSLCWWSGPAIRWSVGFSTILEVDSSQSLSTLILYPSGAVWIINYLPCGHFITFLVLDWVLIVTHSHAQSHVIFRLSRDVSGPERCLLCWLLGLFIGLLLVSPGDCVYNAVSIALAVKSRQTRADEPWRGYLHDRWLLQNRCWLEFWPLFIVWSR